MWGLFELLKFSFSSLIWGVLITILCLILFFVLIKGWYRSSTYTFFSYLIGVILFLFLSFQCTLIVGGLKINNLGQEYAIQLETLINHYYTSNDEVSIQASTQLIDKLIDENPILEYYISGGEFSGYTAEQLPQVIIDTLQTFIRWYIVRRLLWCLFFVGAGAFIVIRTMSVSRKSKYKSHVSTAYSRHGSTSHVTRDDYTQKGF